MDRRNFHNLLSFLCISIVFIGLRCSSEDEPTPVDCTTTDLALSFTSSDPSSCTINNGSITASAIGGAGPYQYALDAQTYSSNTVFSDLGAGTYQLKLKDKNGCERSTTVVLNPFGSTLTATVSVSDNSGCKSSNGSITINASGGVLPYTYTINNGVGGTENMVNSLAAGNYSVKVTDNSGCSVTQTVRVTSGVKLSADIKPIIDANCAVSGCHVSGGGAISFTVIANIIANAAQIKTKTQSGEMPKGGSKLPQEQLDKIACWVDDGAPEN